MKPTKNIPESVKKYFLNTVQFSCRITPPPRTANELNYITTNFEKLAPVDYFSTSSGKHGYFINVIYSPCRDKSWYRLLSNNERLVTNDGDELRDAKRPLVDRLSRLIGIPRYSYIDNNELFFNNEGQIIFKHTLGEKISEYNNKYTLTTAMNEDPFISVMEAQDSIDFEKLRANLRHRFQFFHKFDKVEIITSTKRVINRFY
ncbi:hypothetical protein SBY92_004099 [Candida maltosa Xu316]